MKSPWADKSPDIIIQESSPFGSWTFVAAVVGFLLVWLGIEFFLKQGDYSSLSVAVVFAGFLICLSFATNDVRWTIRSDEIRIDRKWISDRREVQVINRGDIAKIWITPKGDGDGPQLYCIRLWLASGQEFASPRVTDVRARKLADEIESRLKVPQEHATPPP